MDIRQGEGLGVGVVAHGGEECHEQEQAEDEEGRLFFSENGSVESEEEEREEEVEEVTVEHDLMGTSCFVSFLVMPLATLARRLARSATSMEALRER